MEGITMKDDLIGKRVYLLEPHPWSGEIGTVQELKTTGIGQTGYVVELDNGTSCFVFNRMQMQILRK
jgi:hypothetical protein